MLSHNYKIIKTVGLTFTVAWLPTTWAFVMIKPLGSTINPEPLESGTARLVNGMLEKFKKLDEISC